MAVPLTMPIAWASGLVALVLTGDLCAGIGAPLAERTEVPPGTVAFEHYMVKLVNREPVPAEAFADGRGRTRAELGTRIHQADEPALPWIRVDEAAMVFLHAADALAVLASPPAEVIQAYVERVRANLEAAGFGELWPAVLSQDGAALDDFEDHHGEDVLWTAMVEDARSLCDGHLENLADKACLLVLLVFAQEWIGVAQDTEFTTTADYGLNSALGDEGRRQLGGQLSAAARGLPARF
jgi:hypothetical protein